MTGRRIAGAMLAVMAIVAGCGPPARESAAALPDEVVTTEAEPVRVRPTRRPRFHHPKPSSARADFDGDGDLDSVTLRATQCAGGEPGCTFRIRVAMTGVGVRLFPFQCRSSNCTIEAPSDFDGDGRSELVVSLGPGAAINYWGAYRVSAAGVESLGFADPAYRDLDPPYAIFGGSHDSGAESGFVCRTRGSGARAVLSWEARRLRDDRWREEMTAFRLVGDVFVTVGSRVRWFRSEYPLTRWTLRFCT